MSWVGGADEGGWEEERREDGRREERRVPKGERIWLVGSEEGGCWWSRLLAKRWSADCGRGWEELLSWWSWSS